MAFYQSLRDETRYQRGTSEPGQAGWIAERLLRLRALLNAQIVSRRRPDSLVIGSWNIQHFDAGKPRLAESFHYIAEIIDKFDLCAIQEVRDQSSVERLVRLLGPSWDYFINDSSGDGRGNHERMAFVFNRNRILFWHLIGELVIPKGALPNDEQFGRTPFFAAFQAGWFKFTLCSAHIVFTEEEGRPLREDEIRVVGEELAKRAKETEEVHVLIGDLNTDDQTSEGIVALKKAGFLVPEFGPTSLKGKKHYDHIAFAGPADESHMLAKGAIAWNEAVFTPADMEAYRTPAERTYEKTYADWPGSYLDWSLREMSDHLPVWIELKIDYSNEYLSRTQELKAGERP